MLMNDKMMFERYYCINSAKYCENEENIGTIYFITSSHFPSLFTNVNLTGRDMSGFSTYLNTCIDIFLHH